MRTTKPATEAVNGKGRRNPVPPANTLASDTKQDRPGQLLHGAYSLRALVRRSRPPGRRARELLRDMQFAYAVSKGFPTWEAVPRPLQTLIEIAVELDLFRRALFSGFYRGLEIPKRYDGVAELQRRVLVGLGVSGEVLDGQPSLDEIKTKLQGRGNER